MPSPALPAEDEKRAKSKFKLPAAFKRPGSRGSAGGGSAAGAGTEADLPSPTNGAGQAPGAAFDPVAALSGEWNGGASAGTASPDPSVGGVGSPSRLGSVASGPGAEPSAGGGGRGGSGVLLSDADLVDYPYLIDGDPQPAAFLLLCCADYLRLYSTGGCVFAAVGKLDGRWCCWGGRLCAGLQTAAPCHTVSVYLTCPTQNPSCADNVRLGDRSTQRKAAFEAPLAFAAPFMTVHGPGVVSIDAADALQVRTMG